jgi:hypothetical protein
MRFIVSSIVMVGWLVVVPGKLKAQLSTADSTARANAIHNTIQQYHSFLSPVSALYNGPQYIDYTGRLRAGHPFFQSVEYNPGTIWYDDVMYEKIPLKYDIVKNNIIIKDL